MGMAGFVQQVVKFARREGLLREGMGIVVACSGGPDSLALAEVLHVLTPRYQLRLCVAHFEHGIRGAASLADAQFVREYCGRRQLPCVVEAADVPHVAEQAGQSLETMGRELRYAFLERVRKEKGLDVIATAHHADDQAETVLMHLLRGAGLTGLAGIRPRRGCIIRPFLGVTKAQIRAYLATCGLVPHEDATNETPDCLRNRVRLELLPLLRARYNPRITQALGQLAVLAADAQESMASDLPPVHLPIARSVLITLSAARQRLLIRACWREATGLLTDLPFSAVERVRQMVLQGAGSQEQLPHHWLAVLRRGQLTLQKRTSDATEH